MIEFDFRVSFEALTGHSPFPWQEEMYRCIAGEDGRTIPQTVSVPTGLGKTNVIAVWLIALANGANVPRRLVYVVNRRTVVDQTTNEVIRLRDNAHKIGIDNLAISTLRGQFADNREWSADPSRPAVICGTVDMIGSRLLFSGYGVGFRSRPLHAGFLGQDALLVHDEAHLEPAFQRLLETIQCEQKRCGEFARFHVMELTATTRNDNGLDALAFSLSAEDREHPIVKQRIEARKQLSLTTVEDDKQAAGRISEIAAGYKDENVAVVVFVRTLEAVSAIEKELAKTQRMVVPLTGTMRGKERDELVEKPEFKRFLKETESGDTVYLVCTSAGEVGVDISADLMVCDLSTFESMAQRFGRVNRYGDRKETRIEVVYPTKFDDKDKLKPAREATLKLLEALNGDASPLNLTTLRKRTDLPCRIEDAFSPTPTIPPVTDILFDAWALTSIRQPMPGRPPVEPYLHGLAEWQPPETNVAWREEVGVIVRELLNRYKPESLLDEYPLLPHELLRDRSDRVFKQLVTLAKRHADKPVWVLSDRWTAKPMTLGDLTGQLRKDLIEDCTILLPPSAGGLAGGMLDGMSDQADDVADMLSSPTGMRIRVWSDDPEIDNKTCDMRRVLSIELTAGDDEDDDPRRWEWFESLPLEGGRTAKKPVRLDTHVSDVLKAVERIVRVLSLPRDIADAVIIAAELHDQGKCRERFQATLGNRRYPDVLLAKAGRLGARMPEPFRHEFASLLDAQADTRLSTLSDNMKDLVLHLIAAHHGRARPHYKLDEAFDPERPSRDAEALAIETPRRFARLQRKYGRWGLAYLESLLRAADWSASANPSKFMEDQ